MKLNPLINKPRTSVFLILEQFRDDLRNSYKDVAADNVNDIFSPNVTDQCRQEAQRVLSHIITLDTWDGKSLIEAWCELCSEQFFDENPTIDDVLFLKVGDKDNILEVDWVASR